MPETDASRVEISPRTNGDLVFYKINENGGVRLFHEHSDGRCEQIFETRIVKSPNTFRFVVLQDFLNPGPFLDISFKTYTNPFVGDYVDESEAQGKALDYTIEMGQQAYKRILHENVRIKENIAAYKLKEEQLKGRLREIGLSDNALKHLGLGM